MLLYLDGRAYVKAVSIKSAYGSIYSLNISKLIAVGYFVRDKEGSGQ